MQCHRVLGGPGRNRPGPKMPNPREITRATYIAKKILKWFNWVMSNCNPLISLSYTSNTVEEISFLGNLRLLAHSFLNNQKHNITGLLIYKNKQFAQVIEGDETAIKHIWSKIQRDPRHKDIQLLSMKTIDIRSFTKWSMLFPESDKVIEYFQIWPKLLKT